MRHSRRLLNQVFVSLLLVLAVAITGCSNGEIKEQTPLDIPSISESEACAIVCDYLQSQVDGMTKAQRMFNQGVLNKVRPAFHADYMGNGQWSVIALGYGYDTQEEEWRFTSGLWYIYEASRIVEPADTEARNLIEYWQRWKE